MSRDGCVVVFLVAVQMVATAVDVPGLKMNNGIEMPAIALGTSLGFDENGPVTSKNHELRDAVMAAIDIGWRHFDTAAAYLSESEVGEGVRAKIAEGKVKREDMFITTKLWNTHHDQVEKALRESLKQLGLSYVDLYLMHWPIGLNENYTFSDVDFMDTWRDLEEVCKLGLAKSIGVSNFNRDQLERVFKEGSIKPAALQIEVHPAMAQIELVDYAQSQGIVVMGFSPLGSLVPRFGMQFPGPKLDDPDLVAMAKKYGKSTPQIVLRWLIDRKIVPLPKTLKVKRLEENINIFDFKLEKEEIAKINSFDQKIRFTLPSFWQTHSYYPFERIAQPVDNPFLKLSRASSLL